MRTHKTYLHLSQSKLTQDDEGPTLMLVRFEVRLHGAADRDVVQLFLFGIDGNRQYQAWAHEGRIECVEVEENAPHKPFLELPHREAREFFFSLQKAIREYGLVPDKERELEAKLEGEKGKLEIQTAWAERFFAELRK